MKRTLLLAFALFGICIGCGSKPEEAASSSPATTVSYSEVQAIFDKSCKGCHGDAKPAEGISLVSHESLMKGGEHGPTVVAGDAANSLLIQALRGANGKKKMPMGAPPLPEDQIKKVEDWIKAGAKS